MERGDEVDSNFIRIREGSLTDIANLIWIGTYKWGYVGKMSRVNHISDMLYQGCSQFAIRCVDPI